MKNMEILILMESKCHWLLKVTILKTYVHLKKGIFKKLHLLPVYASYYEEGPVVFHGGQKLLTPSEGKE